MRKERRKVPVEDRFWEKVDKSSESECWLWTGYFHYRGYGLLSVRDKQKYAHRLSYEIAFGEIPEGLHVLHKCDNPPCCNPNHLFVGTPKINMQDKVLKGRQRKGETSPTHILKMEQVSEIKRLAELGKNAGLSQRTIAKHFGVNQSVVSRIKNTKAWGAALCEPSAVLS